MILYYIDSSLSDFVSRKIDAIVKRIKMKILIIFNRPPYDNTDVTWNGLRLAGKLLEVGQEVRIFLMNDSVDLAREICKPPETMTRIYAKCSETLFLVMFL